MTPIYEFKCQVCGNTDNVSRSISMDGGIPTPSCSGCTIPMERLWSVGGLHFKGDGWGSR